MRGGEALGDPLVGVIVPTRNRLPLLREAVASVQAQSFNNWELAVVDDASADGTQEWLQTLEDSRVRSIRLHRHSERSAARNLGLSQAQAEFVLFLDDDDRLRPKAVEFLTTLMVRHPGVAAAVGNAEVFSERGTYRGARFLWTGVREPWLEAVGGWCALMGQTLFRRRVLSALGGFRVGAEPAEDQELWMRIGRYPVAFGRKRVLSVRSHAGQGSRGAADGTPAQLAMRERFVAQLRGQERADGERAIAFWWEWRMAQRAYADADGHAFRRHLRAAVRAYPGLAFSPLFRAGLVRKVMKSLLPQGLLVALRDLRSRAGAGV